MRSAWKSCFWRMYLTKSLVLTVPQTAYIYLKRPKGCTLRHKCSIFDVRYEKHVLPARKLWNHQKACNSQCFWRKHRSWTPPWEPILGALEASTRLRSVAEVILTRSHMRIPWKSDFWRMSLTKSLFLAFRGPLETEFGALPNKIWAFNTLVTWRIVWIIKK